MPQLEDTIINAIMPDSMSPIEAYQLFRDLFSLACQVIEQDIDAVEDMVNRVSEKYEVQL